MSRGSARGLLLGLAVVLAAIGLASRVAPLADQDGRRLRQFPTEDGYLMLTIARNLAIGNGMSVADGTIPSNGTQPLATFLWAGIFRLTDGDKARGVFGVLLAELAIAVLGALLLQRLARRVFHGDPEADALALLAAAAWWASPMSVRHSMNCLETGGYALAVMSVVWVFLRGPGAAAGGVRWRAWSGIGLLLGLAFWARNDAVLLCLAVGVAHLANLLPGWQARFGQRFAELACAGTVTVVTVAPWLVHNWLGFGSVVPVSGHTQAFGATFGQNLPEIPIKLFEYLTLFLPVPASIEGRAPAQLLAIVTLGLAAGVVLRAARTWTGPRKLVLVLAGIYGLALAAFYGLSFGAGHFVSRYLFPTSPFLALLWSGAFLAAWRQLAARLPRSAPVLAAAAVAFLAAGLNARLYRMGPAHPHFQVQAWVEAHVPDDVWVGAIQSGTVGFYHDRTINLDGKVNPTALEARRTGTMPAYILSTEIQFLADWIGIASMDRAELAPHFEILVEDADRNLAVLRRRSGPPG